MRTSIDKNLGKPLEKSTVTISDSGLSNFLYITKKRSRYYEVSDTYYVVRIKKNHWTMCAKQAYSKSVDEAVQRMYGEEDVIM